MANSRSFPYLPFGNRERAKAVTLSDAAGQKDELSQGDSVKNTGIAEREGSVFSSEKSTSNSAEESQPFITVLNGNPTDEEIAALTAVVSAMASQNAHDEDSAFALWQRQLIRGQRLGDRLRPGPGSWRRARPM